MDQGALDTSKPLSTSYRETFRRHRKLLCLPIVLGALAAASFLFTMGKTYKSTATLWVDTTATAPSSIGDGSGSSPLAQPPAAAEQSLLTELLTTRAFTAAVAQNSLLGKTLGDAGAIREGAVALLGSGQVTTAVPGGQVLQVSYSASSPAMAKSVLGAVIDQLHTYTGRLSSERDQAAIAYQREQVSLAQVALATARRDVTAYREQHPGVSPTDPRYVSVVAAQNHAVKQLAAANAALSQATGTGNAGSWSVRVIDPPGQPSTTPLRKSKMMQVILGGVLAGLLVSFLAVVALTPSRKEEWEDELPVGRPLVPDVARADPLGPVMDSWLSFGEEEQEQEQRRVRTPSAPSEEP
jgi:uncharacterized protein involved in exopolysaccharide biosynthesis